ncbi:MAG: cellulase family glycosylhydrolase [Bacteroidota bacterium]
MKKLLLVFFCCILLPDTRAQIPFHRGVNLTGWFQADNARKIQFRKFCKKDFADIKSLGCDVIRLPVNLHGMTSGAPDYTIDSLLISMLDSAVAWAEEFQIHLILDNHSFDPAVSTSPDVGQILTKVWPQLADHYKNRSDYLSYEVLNEPHGITNQLWGSIQQETIDAIRSKDARHTIIVGPSGYNSYNDLAQMPLYTDANLIYTFHFYDPFLFTHQGAGWSNPSMEPLAGVPFPYDPATMPECPPDLQGTWIESALNNYFLDGTVEKVKSLIDVAVNFRNTRNVPVYCGEFGVYIPNSDTAGRVNWYQSVRTYLEEKGIPWTTWDYKGGFGLFDKGSNELFDYDLNVSLLGALGFNVPEQRVFSILPDSVGFRIYDDYIEQGINDASYSSSTIDFFSTLMPDNDRYCLYWTGGPQYTEIVLDFVPDKDLSRLVASNYALDLLVRGNVPGTKIDLRFVDTKTADPADHPWRMRTTLTDATSPWDKRWHHLHIPLKDFTEHGSWDNNTWFNPEGKFDWSAIDRFEIVSEYGPLDNKEVWFDNLIITDQDTANVLQTGTLGINDPLAINDQPDLIAIPNPMCESTTLSFKLARDGQVRLSVYNISGQKIADLSDRYMIKGTHSVQWKGKDDRGNTPPSGIYICKLFTDNLVKYSKVLQFCP